MTTSASDLTCKEVVELVTDYLEDTLAASTRRRFDDHLATCPYCQLYLEQMRQTIRTMGQLPNEAISQGKLDVLVQHFRRWR